MASARSAKGNCIVCPRRVTDIGDEIPLGKNVINDGVITNNYQIGEFKVVTALTANLGKPNADAIQGATFTAGHFRRIVTVHFFNNVPPVTYEMAHGTTCDMLYLNQSIDTIHLQFDD